MIHNFILPAFFGAIILLAFIGYGSILRRLFFGSEQFGWANEAAWGMALFIMLGGVLVLTSAVSKNLINTLLFIGVLFMVIDKLPHVPRHLTSLFTQMQHFSNVRFVTAILYVLAFLLVGIQYLHSVNLRARAVNDDLRSYFAYTKQLLETGSFNVDHFDLMRMSNGLGAQSLLQSLMLVNSELNNLMLIDGGVGFLICVGLIFRICSQKMLNTAWTLAILFFFLSLPLSIKQINSSSLITGMVMFLALFTFLDRNDSKATPIKNAFIVGLLFSSACALKSNYAPPLVFALFFSYLWYVYTVRFSKQSILESVLAPVFSLLMLLPWMLTLKRTSDTMFWPILGSGTAETNYGSYLNGPLSHGLSFAGKWEIIFKQFLTSNLFPLLIATGVSVFLIVKIRQRAMAHVYILGALLGALSILLSFDITNSSNSGPFDRYIFVAVSAALLIAFLELASCASGQNIKETNPALSKAGYFGMLFGKWREKFVIFIITAALISYMWGIYTGSQSLQPYQTLIADLKTAADKVEIIPETEYARHKNAQATVPAGEAIFSSDIYTLLYDYNRNKILNASVSGGASPPPGMPYFQDPEAAAAYLLANGVRYISYHYVDHAGYPTASNLWRLEPNRLYLRRAMIRLKFALDQVLGELGASRNRIYDDGTLFIIDLKTPSKVNVPYLAPNYFQMGKFLTLAWAKTEGLDQKKVWTNGHAEISNIEYKLAQGDKLLALNTFGYHPWGYDVGKLNLRIEVNGKLLPFVRQTGNSFYYSLDSITEPIKNIAINSNTFIPLNEQHFIFKDFFKPEQSIGVDVDTIQIL
jgi:hypothetical protein